MPIFPTFPRRIIQKRAVQKRAAPPPVRRHFYNEPGFQTYASFFPLWGGWATAGHCLTEACGHLPPFADGEAVSWPDGLDAALIGCTPPRKGPSAPQRGQRMVAHGFPAGSRHAETRNGTVYHERSPGQWIVQMDDPDEPVVTGMSGGPVIVDGVPIGILITRNSPADLDADGDADESYDFIALSDVWRAVVGKPMA